MTERKVISLETKEKFRKQQSDREFDKLMSDLVVFTCPQCGKRHCLVRFDTAPDFEWVQGVDKGWKDEETGEVIDVLVHAPFEPTAQFECIECGWVALDDQGNEIDNDEDMTEWILNHQQGSAMVDKETEKRRKLLFVFPKCGSDWIQTRSERYRKVNHIYEDNSMEWGDDVGEEEVMDFLCGGCGYVLKFEGAGDFGIADLVKQHQKVGNENARQERD